jgi:hypothetical protein
MNRFFAAGLCVLLAAGSSFAQPPGGGRGGMFGRGGAAMYVQTLDMKEVQEDLKLTDADKEKIKSLKESLTEGDRKFREGMQDLSPEERREKMTARRTEIEKQVKEALGDKYARFHQIKLQLDGMFGSVMADPEVRKTLDVTEDQMREIREGLQGAFQPPGQDASPEERRKAMEESQKKMAEVVDKVITADQKKKWDELVGAKVTYKRPPMGPGGGRGQGRPRGEKKDAPPPGV